MKKICFLIVCLLTTIFISCKKEETNTNTTTTTTSGTTTSNTNTINIADMWSVGNGVNIGWIRQEHDNNDNWVDENSRVIYFTNSKQCVIPLYLDTNLTIHKNVNLGFIKDTLNTTTTSQYWKYSNDTVFEFAYTELNGSCLYNYSAVHTYKIISLSKLVMELRDINNPNNLINRYRKEN